MSTFDRPGYQTAGDAIASLSQYAKLDDLNYAIPYYIRETMNTSMSGAAAATLRGSMWAVFQRGIEVGKAIGKYNAEVETAHVRACADDMVYARVKARIIAALDEPDCDC